MAETLKRIEPKKNRGGVWLAFGAEEYLVPPLSFKAIQSLQDRIQGMSATAGPPSRDNMETVLDVVHASLARNYPDMTRDDVADMVDLQNYGEVLAAVLSTSGFRPAPAGTAPGEAAASIGTASTSP
jgi:hypothetical protein